MIEYDGKEVEYELKKSSEIPDEVLPTVGEYMDAEELFKIAIEENVAFVPGTVFYCDGTGKNTLRINFSFMSKEMNEEGVKRLANAIKKLMR